MLNEFQEKMLDELIESSRAKGYVSLKKVAEIADVDSPEFDEIEKALEFENIHIADKTLEEGEDFDAHVDDIEEFDEENDDVNDEMFEEALNDDPEFADLNNEIENDLKTKDIDEIVSSIVSPSQADDPIKMYLREIGQIDLLNTHMHLQECLFLHYPAQNQFQINLIIFYQLIYFYQTHFSQVLMTANPHLQINFQNHQNFLDQ